jgi:tripartite-type tricarboxylate transporter receptor subunit TctC
MKSGLLILAAISWLFAMMPAGAQEAYPSRPIRMLMPFGAGGTVDIMTRPLAAKLHEQLKRPVIVDNRPSAGGVVAAELVANATPDGHTLFLATSSALFVAPAYYKRVNYDPIKDFSPISLIAQQPLLIVANTSLPFRDLKGLIAYAKERPGKLNYATVGLGSTNHFTAELLSHAAGIKMVLIPYKSGAQGIAAAIGGEVELVFTQPNTGLAHVKAGRVNAIATTGEKRHPLYPEVGTLVEAGYKDLAITGYYTVVGPAKLPRPIVQRLNSEIRRAMESPEVGDVLRSQGTEPVTSTPEALATLMKQETARWQRAAKLTGIKEK